ncbi:alpha/beta hydrolase [Microbacterium sp.]|uniref:alpha/beta hydrolase n=1 Tax=Microbacterium sp. TaxID=51671 RepID=UPI002E2FC503|nr:alpha/beta hydrolase [Microbacterium sp.]HEX5729040.1 alpha/beta hydrolase [Microbacterium sp.]
MPQFTDVRGVPIVYDVHPANGVPRAVVQLAHGYGEHAGRYARLIDALTDRGFTVYADDHRGHGRTGMLQHGDDSARLGTLGRGGIPAAVAAMWGVTEVIRREHEGLPVVLLAHSWGSFMGQMLLNRHPEAYEMVILSGTVYRQLGSGNLGDLNRRWNGPGTTGMEWLSSDDEVVRGFLADPLCTTVPMGKNFGLYRQLQMLGRPRKNLRDIAGRDIPILLLVGRDDPVGGPRSVHRLADAYRRRSGFTEVTTLVYPEIRHEVFNDVGQEQVRSDVLAWLDEHLARSD